MHVSLDVPLAVLTMLWNLHLVISQEDKAFLVNQLYNQGGLPDVGIDDSLLRYSGLNSSVVLQDHSAQLLAFVGSQAPSYVASLGAALAGLSSVPNAVGIGALVVSMILEISAAGLGEPQPDASHLLHRVFAEEKASEVRDLMEEYLKRYRMHVGASECLLKDTRRLEAELSVQLTRLKNSMLHDGHMSTRALKHWVNGAAFHSQMLVHQARLEQDNGTAAHAALGSYLQELHPLLAEYRRYRSSSLEMMKDWYGSCHKRERRRRQMCSGDCWPSCSVCDKETGETRSVPLLNKDSWYLPRSYCQQIKEAYMNHTFSNYDQITGMKGYFTAIQVNLTNLIAQRGVFHVPTQLSLANQTQPRQQGWSRYTGVQIYKY